MGIGSLAGRERRAVFLDRDGVLNRAIVRDGKPYPPGNVEELEILPGVRDSLNQLRGLGFVLVVVTNQPDIARGSQSLAQVEAIHARLRQELPLDDVLMCAHDEGDGCHCRKPRPGMLEQAAACFGLDLRASYLIGDRWRDIDAGHAAGCTTILIDYRYRERPPAKEPSARVGSLAEAAAWIVAAEQGRSSVAPNAKG